MPDKSWLDRINATTAAQVMAVASHEAERSSHG
jgi:hypothetical protein